MDIKNSNAINRILPGLAIVGYIVYSGYKKKSLSKDGAIAALLVAMISVYANNSFAAQLLLFYYSSSKLTKFKSSVKKQLEDQHQEGGNRNYTQVLSNSAPAVVYCLLYHFTTNRLTTYVDYTYDYYGSFLIVAVLAHFACCNGDTWASELGILSSSNPILITKLRRVPKGTNGGVSTLGLFASLAGGLFIGFVQYISTMIYSSFYPDEIQKLQLTNQFFSILLISSFAGLFGSILDSILGATLQYSVWSEKKQLILCDDNIEKTDKKEVKHISGYKVLDNHQVNFLSSLATALICAYFGYYIF
ncbi:hypothetical protein DLAC_08334 [Tieghemostelium lacteum]|uniref:Transmembrane protein 19 n=1 Tax=Tieghemostelium lacteum TaxID=361077 RepID=A0A151ZBR2_TIELA|nr:hypothetical protein DLAC_08334 [Tieghemostelium lacteum]|eukprot:KYQ91378.1 hypothetical protein DLAC_08334 [Tieghemostelium lacteum]